MLDYMFSHLLWFSMMFAMFATIVKELNANNKEVTIIHLLKRMIVASGSGVLFFFITFDYRDFITPSKVLAGSLLMGYCGSTLFDKLIDKYNLATRQDEEAVPLNDTFENEPLAFVVDDTVTVEDLDSGAFELDDTDGITNTEVDDPWLDEDKGE